jgi:hypothetical protein
MRQELRGRSRYLGREILVRSSWRLKQISGNCWIQEKVSCGKSPWSPEKTNCMMVGCETSGNNIIEEKHSLEV